MRDSVSAHKFPCMPMPILTILAAVVLAAGDSTPKSVAPKSLTELEARIRAVLDSEKVPGIGLAIVRHDTIIYSGGMGRARVSPRAFATDSTLFRIGSTSKAFIALTAQALAREGKLKLDMPLSQALPGFYFKNDWEATDPVRIVHLLEHTSGFDDNSLKSYANSDPTPLALAPGLALDSATRVSRWRPGTRFSYCNTGPAIVALIIEKIEGKPIEQVVQERWFTPIGMRTATYFRPDTTKLPTATLYRADGVTAVPYWHVFIRPAGSINASARDMSEYVRFLLGRGTIDGKELLPRESLERMERSESSLASRAGLTVGYGLHLYRIADTTGFTWTGHNGGVEGGLSDLSYLPAQGIGYAFQINSGNGKALQKITGLVRAFLTQGLLPPDAPPRVALSARTRTGFAGWYREVSPRVQHLYPLERIASITHVTFTDSSMTMTPIVGSGVDMVPVDSLRFRRKTEPEATLAFVHDATNGRDAGIESVGAGLGASMARVSAIDAVGTFVTAAVFVIAQGLALLAVVFGGARWIVQRLRHRPHVRGPAAFAWRATAMMAVLCAANIGLLIVGSNDIRAIGSLTPLSGTSWLAGVLFALGAVPTTVIAFRHVVAGGRWSSVSLWTVRAVAVLDVAAAAYLVVLGWTGWRTWA